MIFLPHDNGNDTVSRIGNNDSITAGIKDFLWGDTIPGFDVLVISRDSNALFPRRILSVQKSAMNFLIIKYTYNITSKMKTINLHTF